MTELNWQLSRIQHYADAYKAKVKQFGLTVLDDVASGLSSTVVEGFRSVGVWALQNPHPIVEAITHSKPFTVLVGMRPPKQLHWGHLTLLKELKWLCSIGGQPKLVLADYEAGTYSDDHAAARILTLFGSHFEDYMGRKLPADLRVISDRSNTGLRQFQDEVNHCLDVKSLLRLYGWNEKATLAELQTCSLTAAAFLYPSRFDPEIPTLVLSDINQVTHAEVTRMVAKELNIPFPSFSYRLLLPSLQGPDQRMSVSNPASLITLGTSSEEIGAKLARSFSGGRPTVAEQKLIGGEPFRCSFFATIAVILDSETLETTHSLCTTGAVTCSDCKESNVPRVLTRIRS